MATINVGRVRPVFCGEYQDDVQYVFYDCVRYEGTWWLHIGANDTTGDDPIEGSVWTAFGVKGDAGSAGSAATIEIGSVSSGSVASVTNSGTSDAATLNFVLPKGDKGDKGDTGDPFAIIKTYQTLADMEADFSGEDTVEGDMVAIVGDNDNNGNIYIKGTSGWVFATDLSSLEGVKGDQGAAATVSVGTVTTGETPSVTNSGTTGAAVLDFVLPAGVKGDPGDSVTAATINEDGELVLTTGQAE